MARNVDDITKYWQKLAKEQGLSEKAVSAVLEVLSDEQAGKAFAQAFVPQSDYSRDLDKVRDEWKPKAETAQAELQKYNEWYEKTAKPAYEHNVKVADKLKQYEDQFGALDGSTVNKPPADVVTKQDLEELAARMSGNTARVLKDVTTVTLDHYKRFGEPMDVDALEKFAVEKGLPIRAAYDQMIQPKLRERETAEWEAKVKTAKEEAVREYASQHHIPVDSKPAESHPFFDRKEVPQGTSDLAQTRAGRDAFLAALNEQPAGTATR